MAQQHLDIFLYINTNKVVRLRLRLSTENILYYLHHDLKTY